MIYTSDVRHSYSDTKLSFPDISLDSGSQLLITGSSGSGKSTLLHIISGILKPTNGVVTISGKDIYKLSESQRDRFRGETIGIIYQKPYLVNALSVYQNVTLSRYAAGLSDDSELVDKILKRLGIYDKKNHSPDTLSIGQQQRVSIARALAISPTLIIADEPTSSLDDRNAREVINLLQETSHDFNCALIVTTHDQRVKERFVKILELGEVAI